MQLTEDIRSTFNPERIYGYHGDEITVISDRNGICIVEGKNGVRFSVDQSLLTEDKVEMKIEAAPDAAAPDKSITHRVPASKKTTAPINQQSLFNQ